MSDKEESIHNLLDAIPKSHERFLSTIQIWHRCKHPKPKYHVMKSILKYLVEDDDLHRVGGNQGRQIYRYKKHSELNGVNNV